MGFSQLGGCPMKIQKWWVIAILVLAFVAAFFMVNSQLTGWRAKRVADRRLMVHATQEKICEKLDVYEHTHGWLPKSLDTLSFTNTPLEREMAPFVRKFYYYRLDKGGYWLGYYEDDGFSETLTSVRNTSEGEPPAPANGDSPGR
jgi:hypothetical protein